jgi:hypothetical protein
VVTVLGRRIENDAVATVYEPPYRAAMQGTSSSAPFLVTLTFASHPDGTRVGVRSDIVLRGSARLLGPLVVALYGAAWVRGLTRLKRLMESGAL